MAKRKIGEKPEVLYRTQVFEARPVGRTLDIILAVSEVLRQVFNRALSARRKAFEAFIAPVYEELKLASKAGQDVAPAKKKLAQSFKEHGITLFDQINELTTLRKEQSAWGEVTRNFLEETLVTLDGAVKSFLALRKNGDYDAKMPRERPEGTFSEIRGRFGFKVEKDKLILSCGKIARGEKLIFSIPEYQQKELGKAQRIKEFRIRRDIRDLSKPGRYIVSVTYEIEKPEKIPLVLLDAAFVALGASSIGIISKDGVKVQKLWRPDKHWEPKIAAVEARMKKLKRGSRKWGRLNAAKRRMEGLKARQQKHNQQTLAKRIAGKSVHVVVTDLVVRSKVGKLADSGKPSRGGMLGLNWSAQNTGSIGRLVAHMEDKTAEKGGRVLRHKLVLDTPPPGKGHRNKRWMAERLRESFLASLDVGVVKE